MLIFRALASSLLTRICLGGIVTLAFNAMAAGELPVGRAAGDMDLSPFYRWQDPMPTAPGVLLRSETLKAQERVPAAAQTIRMLYSSTDQRWNSGQVPVSGTLFLPTGPAPAEGWPLLAWAHGTLGIADICAPSWTGFRARDAAYLNRWLERGFAVVATDYQGLGGPGPHPYTVWQAEGSSVLDAVRAARALKPGVISNRTILAGRRCCSGRVNTRRQLCTGAQDPWRGHHGAQQHIPRRAHRARGAPFQHRVPVIGDGRLTRKRAPN